MVTIQVERTKDRKIRRYFDEKSNIKYFCIVDVIGTLTKSENPQNYWKVFKNRLKKKDAALVSRISPQKMRASDGKNYITDTGDQETVIRILHHVPKISSEALELLRKSIDEGNVANVFEDQSTLHKKQNTRDGAKLLIDGYETKTSIVIEAMLAGVKPEDITVSVEKKKVTIQGRREKPKDSVHIFKSYLREELEWIPFSRVITLPHSIQPDKVETREDRGHLIIELAKVRQQL